MSAAQRLGHEHGVADAGQRAHGAEAQRAAVHDRGVTLDSAARRQVRAEAGIGERVVFEHGYGARHGFQRAAVRALEHANGVAASHVAQSPVAVELLRRVEAGADMNSHHGLHHASSSAVKRAQATSCTLTGRHAVVQEINKCLLLERLECTHGTHSRTHLHRRSTHMRPRIINANLFSCAGRSEGVGGCRPVARQQVHDIAFVSTQPVA